MYSTDRQALLELCSRIPAMMSPWPQTQFHHSGPYKRRIQGLVQLHGDVMNEWVLIKENERVTYSKVNFAFLSFLDFLA